MLFPFPFPVIPGNNNVSFPFPTFGNEISIPVPVPKNWEWNFHSRSRSQKLGIQFIIPVPVPKVWEWVQPFPFPFPNGQKSFPLTPVTIYTQDYLDLPPWQELANCSYVLTADDLGVPFQCCWCFPRNDSADGIPWQDGANSPRSRREQKGRRCIFRSPGGILPLRCCVSFIFVTFIFVTKYKYQKMKIRVSRGGILPF